MKESKESHQRISRLNQLPSDRKVMVWSWVLRHSRRGEAWT